MLRSIYPALFLFICLACDPGTTNKSPLPNIVIIFADDMGYGDVSILNPEARVRTPHIDAMAKYSIIFTNAHASASVCTPSRYGLLTGRYAWRSDSAAHVVNGFGRPVINPGRETIGSLLQKVGYTTACIGKWHLGLEWETKDGSENATFDKGTGYSNVDYTKEVANGPNAYGFDYSFIQPASLDMPPYMFLRNHLAIDPEIVLTSDVYPDRLEDTEYSWDKKHTSEHDVYWGKGVWWRRGEMSASFRIENCLTGILDEGISFLERQAGADKPFLLYLPLTGPHTPWVPTEQFRGKSPIGTYGDFIMDIDLVVGEVNKTLEDLGIDDNTMVIFSSDNGAYWPQEEIELQQHEANWGRKGQKGDIWDGGHRVPLLISWPYRISGQVVFDQLVSLTDLFRTFADLTNQETEAGSGEDSFSFMHVLEGQTDKAVRPSMVHQSSRGMFGIRKNEWKFIEGLGSGGFTALTKEDSMPAGTTAQLYQIEIDSMESANVLFQYPEIVDELRRELNGQRGK